jgi:hypothetical protein
MSTFNTKKGNIRGVKLQYSKRNEYGNSDDWTERLPVQGWVVWNNDEHRFDINFDVEEYDVEILLSLEALINLTDAIIEAEEIPDWESQINLTGI